MALLSVLFALVNVADQSPAGQARPFTGAVFEHYYKRLSCHLESKSELHSAIPTDLNSLQGNPLDFEITDEDFDLYAVYIHEPMKSNWWTFNIDAVQIFQFKTGKRYVHLSVLD